MDEQLINNEETNDQFVNVYNFIPLPLHKQKKYKDTDKHTGYIEYTLTTKTPLFIPNTSNDNFFRMNEKVSDHKSYDFFSYTDVSKEVGENCHEPVIPGSEVRGMIRSIYETLTDSCLSILNNDQDLSKRIGTPFNPGLLQKNGNKYTLFDATSYGAGSDKKIRYQLNEKTSSYIEGQKVTIDTNGINAYTDIEKTGLSKTGYVMIGEMGATKKTNVHVYVLKGEGIADFSEKEIIDLLIGTIDSYQLQQGGEGRYQDYKEALLKFLDGEGEKYFPVNYKDAGDYIYLSCSRLSREVSQHKVKEFVREFNPCKSKEDMCPACDLFGNVQNDWAKTSKIRFEDLKVVNKQKKYDGCYYPRTTLPILGSPKMSNTAFYFKAPEGSAKYWTFDYYAMDQYHAEIINKPAEIQGRKYYWHHKPNMNALNVEPEKMNKTIRPLKENITFKGRLYFDGISMKQVEQMEMILDGFNQTCSYKLGSGKPLGLGSVSLKVTSVKERITKENNQICYREKELPLTTKTYESLGFSKEVKNGFMLICDFNATDGMEVSYPLKDQNSKGFEWYAGNLKMPVFKQPLKPLNASVHSAKDVAMSKKDGLYEKIYFPKKNTGSSKNRNNDGNKNKNKYWKNNRSSY